MTQTITLPSRQRGRPTTAASERYEEELETFCEAVLEIESKLDFRVSSRGWCYILEEHRLTKGDFDRAQDLINDARKRGLLPIEICAEDESRQATAWEKIDDETAEEFADDWIDTLESAYQSYTPFSFWENQDHYVEVICEKIDLKSLFESVCGDYRVRIANAKGWGDINGRARIMRRFEEWEDKGKQCVLLYCGDHDPAGLNISGSLMSLFEELEGAVGWDPSNLIIERFGLNADFIDANNLTWIDNLQTSSGGDLSNPRHADHKKRYVQDYIAEFGVRKCEANALVVRPEQGRQLCRDAILKYVDLDAGQEYRRDLTGRREEAREIIASRWARS